MPFESDKIADYPIYKMQRLQSFRMQIDRYTIRFWTIQKSPAFYNTWREYTLCVGMYDFTCHKIFGNFLFEANKNVATDYANGAWWTLFFPIHCLSISSIKKIPHYMANGLLFLHPNDYYRKNKTWIQFLCSRLRTKKTDNVNEST